MKEPTPEITKEAIYHVREVNGSKFPRITICIAQFGDVFCRGISICSFSEAVNLRQKAIHMARGRAIKAYMRKGEEGEDLPVVRREAKKVISSCGLVPDFVRTCKSQYNVLLTANEIGLLSEKNE